MNGTIDEGNPPRVSLVTTDAPGIWINIAYGIGVLVFMLAPMLIPGTDLQTAVLEASGVHLFIFLGLCLWGIVHSLRRTAGRNARHGRRAVRPH